MFLHPPQHPPAPAHSTYTVGREDVLWGRPIFRAPALTVFTAPEFMRNGAPVFPVRHFRAVSRKKSAA